MSKLTKIKLRKLWILFLNSIVGLKRNLWLTFISVLSTTVLLSLIGSVYVLSKNADKLTTDVENDVTINVFLDTSTNDNSEFIVDANGENVKNENYQKIYNSILTIKNVKSVKWSNKEEQLEQLVAQMGSTWSAFEKTTNPLYDVYVVTTDSPKQIKSVSQEIAKIKNVADVKYGGENTDKIISLAKNTRIIATTTIGILLIIVVLLISNIIRLTIMARQDEIQINKLVGATNTFIKLPFVFEGVWIGLLGSILPTIVLSIIYKLIYQSTFQMMNSVNISLLAPSTIIYKMAFLMVGIGIFVGIIASNLSMNKYLKI
jgi:cell division transport system permease protein